MAAWMFAAALAFAPPPAASPTQEEGARPARIEPVVGLEADARPARGSRLPVPLRRYLRRSVPHQSARFLDHGVLSAYVAGGTPHIYRLGLGLGLLDHLTIGLTANWLPGATAPSVSPEVALAFWRFRYIEIGARYAQVLHPPRPAPTSEDDPSPRFPEQTHLIYGTAVFSASWLSAGFDAGVARFREAPIEPTATPTDFETRWRLSGGLFFRVGTRRWGFSAAAHLPVPTAEITFDLRFGLFEARDRGGWRQPEQPASDRAARPDGVSPRTIR